MTAIDDQKYPVTNSSTSESTATVYYFGYGSNMSPANLQIMKQITPISTKCAFIPNWKLVFSLKHELGSYASIHPSKDSEIHGTIIELTIADFNKLSIMEKHYSVISLNAHLYSSTETIEVKTFYFSEKHCKIICTKDKSKFIAFLF